MKNLINEWFKFKEWFSYQSQPKEFENTLEPFMWINTYNNFKDFLEHNEIHLEDSEGDLFDIHEVLSTKENFSDFLENQIVFLGFNNIDFEQINEPFIYAQVKDNSEAPHNFITLNSIKSEDDLLAFINEVFRDIGEVTHSTGIKNKYEVIGIDKN